MHSVLSHGLVGWLLLLWLSAPIRGQVVLVAAHDATPDVKATSAFVCSGAQDEVMINRAIASLAHEHQQALSGGHYLPLDLRTGEPTEPRTEKGWQSSDAETRLQSITTAAGAPGLQIRGGAEAYPGIRQQNLQLDLRAFEAFELLVRSESAIKLRVILQDVQQQELRYHEKLPAPGNWHRVRFQLSQPYRGAADLAAIRSIDIQATSELANCEFSVAQAGFTRSIALDHQRLHPGTLQVRCGDRQLQPGTEYAADLELGKLWLFSELSASVSYRYGGGTVKLAAGNYRIDSPAGIEISSYCELDLHGATLSAADNYATGGQLLQTAPDLPHTHVTIRGGQLRGQRMKWSPRQNISGIVLRDTDHVLIEGCDIADFNSVGLAVINTHYKDATRPRLRQVTIANNRLLRCATEYVDIRGDLYGEVGKGADHKAMLRLAGIQDFEIRHNRLEDSFGDAKWVVACQDGMIIGNTFDNSRMGSYFVEGSVRVIGTANMVRNAGSRAVTIERGSHHNTFANNVIINSYREGLWLMGCSECIIQGNRFENNGWRNSAGLDSAIKLEWQPSFAEHPASFNLIAHNVIKTQPHQDQAIWIASGENSRGNVITDNTIIGAQVAVRDEGVATVEARNQTH